MHVMLHNSLRILIYAFAVVTHMHQHIFAIKARACAGGKHAHRRACCHNHAPRQTSTHARTHRHAREKMPPPPMTLSPWSRPSVPPTTASSCSFSRARWSGAAAFGANMPTACELPGQRMPSHLLRAFQPSLQMMLLALFSTHPPRQTRTYPPAYPSPSCPPPTACRMQVVQDVDPDFRRTVFIASKFDNRLKEFGERKELEQYLSAAGYLPPSVKPFFVALPKVDVGGCRVCLRVCVCVRACVQHRLVEVRAWPPLLEHCRTAVSARVWSGARPFRR